MWSLEIEVQFYLVSPLLLFSYIKIQSRIFRVLSWICISILFIVIVSIMQVYYKFDTRYQFGLLAHMHFFIAGIVAADILRAGQHLTLPNLKLILFDILLVLGFAGFLASGRTLSIDHSDLLWRNVRPVWT